MMTDSGRPADGLEATLAALSARATAGSYVPTVEDVTSLLARVTVSGDANHATAVVAAFFTEHWGIETSFAETVREYDAAIRNTADAADVIGRVITEAQERKRRETECPYAFCTLPRDHTGPHRYDVSLREG